jgi:hypothetical protein
MSKTLVGSDFDRFLSSVDSMTPSPQGVLENNGVVVKGRSRLQVSIGYHLRDSTSSAFVGKAFLLLSEKSSPFRGLRPYISIVHTWKLRSSSPLSCGTDSSAGQWGTPRVRTSEVDPGFGETDPTSWNSYLEDVTRFHRVQLLALAASATACEYRIQHIRVDIAGREWTTRSPTQAFSLAAVAPDSILSGFATPALTPRKSDLVGPCEKYLNLEDPLFSNGNHARRL